MNTTGNMSFLQEIGLGILDIIVSATTVGINFLFSLLSALISSVLLQNGVNTTGLFGS